jgi:hypothetical protein
MGIPDHSGCRRPYFFLIKSREEKANKLVTRASDIQLHMIFSKRMMLNYTQTSPTIFIPGMTALTYSAVVTSRPLEPLATVEKSIHMAN